MNPSLDVSLLRIQRKPKMRQTPPLQVGHRPRPQQDALKSQPPNNPGSSARDASGQKHGFDTPANNSRELIEDAYAQMSESQSHTGRESQFLYDYPVVSPVKPVSLASSAAVGTPDDS